MKKISFIWDFDGTLVESYQIINKVLEQLYLKFEIPYDKKIVNKYIIDYSVGELLVSLSKDNSIPLELLTKFFKEHQVAQDDSITLMPYAKEVLQKTKSKGIKHFILTHKGSTTQNVLDHLEISPYFTEVVTSANGFERKPNPDGINYLIEKYNLDKENTYYIGDRRLDLEVAVNAKIKSINFNQEDSEVNTKIKSLQDILTVI